MKKAAIFLNQFLPMSEIFVRHQSEALTEFTPKYIACRKVSPSVGDDIDAVILNESGSKKDKFKELFFKLTLRNLKLQQAARNCDVIHAHFGPTGWLASGIAHRLKKPLIVTFHGFDVSKNSISIRRDGLLQKLFHLGRHKLGRRAAKFICVSEFLKSRAIAFGFPADKCIVHYMGIPLREHTTPKHIRSDQNAPVRLLAVGRLTAVKGHAKLIEAAAEMEARGYNIELNIVGNGDLKDALEAQAAASLKKYKFWGAQPHEKVISLMRQSDIFCHSSITLENGQAEAFGLVILEAQWAGLPVVAFDNGGIAEAVERDKTGFLVEEGDVKGYANALCCLIDTKDLLKTIAHDAPKFVAENFDNKQQTKKLEDIYNSVL